MLGKLQDEIQEIRLTKTNQNIQHAQYSIPLGDNDDIYYSSAEFKNDNSSLNHSSTYYQLCKTNCKEVSEEIQNSKFNMEVDFTQQEETWQAFRLSFIFSSQTKALSSNNMPSQINNESKQNLKNSQFKQSAKSIFPISSQLIVPTNEQNMTHPKKSQQQEQTSIAQMKMNLTEEQDDDEEDDDNEDEGEEEDEKNEKMDVFQDNQNSKIVSNGVSTISKKLNIKLATTTTNQISEIIHKSTKRSTPHNYYKQRTSNTNAVNTIQFQKGIFILQTQFKGSLGRQEHIDQKMRKFIQLLKCRYRKRSTEDLTQLEHQAINDLSDYTNNSKNHPEYVKFLLKLYYISQKLSNEIKILRVFMPNDRLVKVWDCVQVVYNFFFFFIYSICIFFANGESDIGFFQFIFDIFYHLLLLDIFFIMNTAYYFKDKIISKRLEIFKNYLKSTFIFDLISFLSSIQMTSFNEKQQVYNPDHQLKHYAINLLVFLRIVGIVKKKGIFENIQTLSNSQRQTIKLINQLLFMITFAHTLGICWYLLGQFESLSNIDNNWLCKYNIDNNSWYSKYLFSLYWSVTTMTTGKHSYLFLLFILKLLIRKLNLILMIVGYGDITPANHFEALFNTISMILFSCVFAYSINNIGMILQEIEKGTKELKDNIIVMQRYMKQRNVNNQLKSRILHYLHFLASEVKDKNKSSEDKIISMLSNKLRDELTLEVNSKMICNCTLLDKIFSQQTIKKLIYSMEEIQASPNEVIFKEDDREKFLQIIKNNNEDFQRYKMLEEQVCINGEVQSLNVHGCFSCGQADHYSINCKRSHLVVDKQFVILRNNFFQFQSRSSFNRNTHRPKFITQSLLLVQHNPAFCLRLIDNILNQGGEVLERIEMYTYANLDSEEEKDNQRQKNKFYSESSSDNDFNEDEDEERKSELTKKSQMNNNMDDKMKKQCSKDTIGWGEDTSFIMKKSHNNGKIDKVTKNQQHYNVQLSHLQEDDDLCENKMDYILNREQTQSFSKLEKKVGFEEKVISSQHEDIMRSVRFTHSQTKQSQQLQADQDQQIQSSSYRHKSMSQESSIDDRQKNKININLKKLESQRKTKMVEKSDQQERQGESQKNPVKEKPQENNNTHNYLKETSMKQVNSDTRIAVQINTTQDQSDTMSYNSKKVPPSVQNKPKTKLVVNDEERHSILVPKNKKSLMKLFTKLITMNIEAKVEQEINEIADNIQQNNSEDVQNRKNSSNTNKNKSSFLQALLQDQNGKGGKFVLENIFEIFQKKGNSASTGINKMSVLSRALENFDQVCIFSKFFPHNNITSIISQLKPKKISNTRQSQKSPNKNTRRHNIFLADFSSIQKEILKFDQSNSLKVIQDSSVFEQKYRPTVLSYGVNTKNSLVYPIRYVQ